MERGREAVVVRRAGQKIARELQGRETVEARVGVERADDPIAPRPDGASVVLFVALRIGVAREIGPPTRPVFAEPRRREQAVDRNLARVAGVTADRNEDGEGMTMLIPAFLGSDGLDVDVLLDVPGPGPVVDVVVDYKDLIRMTNAKAVARAALQRLPVPAARTVVDIARTPRQELLVLAFARLREALDEERPGAAEVWEKELAEQLGPQVATALHRTIADARQSPAVRTALTAWLEQGAAQASGCRVAVDPAGR